jgi:hypothetical protein
LDILLQILEPLPGPLELAAVRVAPHARNLELETLDAAELPIHQGLYVGFELSDPLGVLAPLVLIVAIAVLGRLRRRREPRVFPPSERGPEPTS